MPCVPCEWEKGLCTQSPARYKVVPCNRTNNDKTMATCCVPYAKNHATYIYSLLSTP